MTKTDWISVISDASLRAGTYQSYFDPVIETLAGILAKRDDAQEQFEASGGALLVKHTNKAGAKNIEQNPLIRLINDLNRDALAYWRDLGLTPAGLKRINENAMQKPKRSALAEALKELA